MATYFPPEVPPVFVGGQQPYAGKQIAAFTASIDNPPGVRRRYQELSEILQLWQPPDPQPQQKPRLLPPSITAVPVDNPPGFINDYLPDPVDPFPLQPRTFVPQAAAAVTYTPPFVDWLPTVLSAWQLPDPFPTQARNLPVIVTAVPVDNPPFLPEELDQAMNQTVQAWNPPDPWPTQRQTTFIPGMSVENPPPNADQTVNFYQIIFSWQPPDPQPTQLRAFVPPAVVVSFNPFVNLWLNGVLATWQPPDPSPQQRLPGQIVSVDNPPSFADDLADMNQIVGGAWQPPDPWPTQPRYTQIVSVDNPPGFRSLHEDRTQIISAWQPADPWPTQPRYFYVQPFVVTYVPFVNEWLPGVVASWQPLDPTPQQRRPMQVVSVDNPPFEPNADELNSLAGIVTAWQPPDPSPTQKRPMQIVSVDQPPFMHQGRAVDQIAQVAQVWQSDPWTYSYLGPASGLQPYAARQLNPTAIAVSVDNPPFTYRGRIPITANIVQSWQPPDPQPFQRGPLPVNILAVAVNNPPFSSYGRLAIIGNIIASWQPPDPQPWQRLTTLPIVGQSKDQPPAITNALINLFGIIGMWQPPDPQPLQPRYKQRISVDNPPPYSVVDQMGAVQFWQPPDPQPLQPRYLYVQPGVVVTYVPFNQEWLVSVIASWQPPDPAPTQRRTTFVPGMSVDNPPSYAGAIADLNEIIQSWQPLDPAPRQPRYFYVQPGVVVVYVPFSQDWLPAVLSAWQPPDPIPTQRRTTFVAGMSVDNPPRYAGALSDFTQIVSTWWQPPDPQPVQKSPTLRISVDQPRPRQMAWFATVIQSWQPDPWTANIIGPVTGRQPYGARQLPISVTAVPVDNPPFDMRARLTKDIVDSWQPQLYAYSRFYTRGNFIPFTVAQIVKHPQLRGTLTVTTLVGIDGAPLLRGTKATPNLDGDP